MLSHLNTSSTSQFNFPKISQNCKRFLSKHVVLIKKNCSPILKELTAFIGIVAATSLYMDEWDIIPFIGKSAAYFTANTVMKVYQKQAFQEVSVSTLEGTTEPKERQEIDNIINKGLNGLQALVFAKFSETSLNILIHEMGHALAVNSLLENAQTEIRIFPSTGSGSTTFYVFSLTTTGEFFGKATSRLIIAGAGPAMGVLLSSIELAAAYRLRKKTLN
jgi:hypothetical protein